MLIYGALALTMNSRVSSALVDLIVGWRFSGELSWERSSWGPEPWDVRLYRGRVTDATGEELVALEQLEVDDYLYLGLLDDHIAALGVRLVSPRVKLKQRAHLFRPRTLEWDIAELFQPPYAKLDDGEPLPPITLSLLGIELEGGEVSVDMGVTRQVARGIEVRGGRFGFDLERKFMDMGASRVSAEEGESLVWVRRLEALPPRDRIFKEREAPIELSLEHQLSELEISSFWWLGDAFGASSIRARVFEADQVSVRDARLALIPGGTPEMSGVISAQLRSISPYVAPWDLDSLLKGELKAEAELFGPVSDPCARSLKASGQLFLPFMQATLFDLKASKDRSGLAQLSALRVWSGLGDLEASGALELSSMRGLFKLGLNSVKWSGLTPIPLAWRPWGVEARGGLTLKVRPSDTHGVELGAELQTSLDGPAPLKVDARATLSGPELKLHYAELSLGEPKGRRARRAKRGREAIYATAQGQLDLERQRVDAELRLEARLHPRSLPPLELPLQGQASLELKAKGPLKAPQLEGELKGSRLKGWAGELKWALSTLRLPFKLNSERLSLSHFKLKGASADMEGSLSAPLSAPEQLQGWTLIYKLPLELSPIDVPVSGDFSGVMCTGGQGCSDYFKRHPLSRAAEEGSCLKNLSQRLEREPKRRRARGISPLELCLTGHAVQYEKFSLNELGLSGRWDSERRRATLRRLRMWKGPRLLLDAEGQLDLKAGQFQSELKLLDFPLQLVQLFTPTPPPELRTLYGVVDGELTLGGPLARPTGRGSLTAKRLSVKLSQLTPPLPLRLGLAHARFELSPTGLSAEGHLGRQVWLSASIPLRGASTEQSAQLGLDLYGLPISYYSATPKGELGYQAELKQLERMLLNADGLAPLSLSDPNDQLQVISLGRAGYCALSALKLPGAQLSTLSLQGHFDISALLGADSTLPSLSADLEGFALEHWMWDALGALKALEHKEGPTSADQELTAASPSPQGLTERGCHRLCDGRLSCPTISLASPRPAQLRAESVASPFDRMYLNPQPWIESAASSALKRELSVLGWRAGERSALGPFTLRGPHQQLTLQAAMIDRELSATLKGEARFATLGPFLEDLFQRLEGDLKASLKLSGPVSSPMIEGGVELREVALLSPRSQIIGDIRQVGPISLKLSALDGGGLEVSLPSAESAALLRNEGEVTLKELSVSLPQLSFKRLSVGFSARQLEAKLPDLGRLTAQLKGMRFVMQNSADNAPPQLSLSGDIDILRGLYTADIVSSDEINQGVRNNFTGRTAVETLSVFDRSPILKRLKLDLNLRGEDDLVVRNQIGGVVKLNLGVSLDLNVRGYLYALPSDPLDQQLQLSGEVNTLDGSTITYANNTFDVIDGRVNFGDALQGAARASAFMNAELEATHIFRIPRQSLTRQQVTFDRTLGSDLIDEEVTLRAQVLMPTKESKPQVELDLSSQSGASKIEVATLVITGRYPNNLNAAASTQPATEVLLAPILNLIERPIEDSLGLNLSLTPETSGAGLFIDLNKSFSRRLRLYARTPIGEGDDDSPQSFGLEYKLNNILSSELTREQISQSNATSGRLRLRLSWD